MKVTQFLSELYKASSRSARAFTSGPRDLARIEQVRFSRDPSLRLKNGWAQDDTFDLPS